MIELKNEVQRQVLSDNLEDTIDCFLTHIDCLIHINHNHREAYDNNYQLQARILSQMIFSKSLAINNLLNGMSYDNGRTRLNKIIDPTAIAVKTRNIFETTSLFHLVYRFHTGDQATLIYCLWVLSGLRYRQRFGTSVISLASQEILDEELKNIEHIKNVIRTNPAYIALDETHQGRIEHCIKKREFKITIENNEVKILAWHEAIGKMGFTANFHDKLYNYLSLYGHPSNTSVEQFSELFRKESKEFLGMSQFNLKITINLLSAFIADYINFFPETMVHFESLTDLEQIVVNFSNKAMRGNEYTINEKYKILEGE